MSSLLMNVVRLWCLVQLTHSLPASNSGIPPKLGTPSCEQVKPFFAQNNFSDTHLLADFMNGTSLAVCESSDTCCTPAIETVLLKTTSREFRVALRVATVPFRDSFAQAVTDIESKILSHIGDSKKKTLSRFSQLSDRSFTNFARGPIGELFKQLATFATTNEKEIDISHSVSEFFDELYAYLHGQGSPDYAACVRKTQTELRPFGEIPRRLAVRLSRNLQSCRALLTSLRLAADAIGEGSNADLSNECVTALLRSTSCAQCRGYSLETRTCHGLCANVARGCLAHVADVDQPWNELLESMEKLIAILVNERTGSQDIFASVESRLSEAVLYALENAPMLDKKVKKICGEPPAAIATSLHGHTESAVQGADDVAHDDGTSSSSSNDLGSRLRSLGPVLASARGFFAVLPDLVCSDKSNRFSGQADSDCWNGQRLAEYTKPVVGIGTGAQKYNPEVRVSRSDIDANFAQLSDKLRHARQAVSSKTILTPEPDSLLLADFGSGSGDNEGSQWPTRTDSETDPVVFKTTSSNSDSEINSGSGDTDIAPDPYEPEQPRQKEIDESDGDLNFVEESTTRTTTATTKSSGSLPKVSTINGLALYYIISILCWGSLHWF